MYHVAEGSFPAEKDVRPGDIIVGLGKMDMRAGRDGEPISWSTVQHLVENAEPP